MMQWLALQYVWVSLIIPAILVLYLLKRKYEERTISSVLLWQQVLQIREVSRPFQRLRNHLLLLLQLLIALLLLLALIKPAISGEGMIAEHTVVVIDTSGSMGAKEGNVTRFQLAKKQAASLIEKLGNGQTMTLIEAGNVPRVLLSHSGDQDALLEQLNSLSLRYGTTDTLAALSLARAIAASVPGSGVMWFGDGAAGKLEDHALAGFTPDTFRFIQTGSSKENVSIGAFVTQPGQSGWIGLVRVDNHGAQKRQGTLMIYDVNHQLLAAKPFEAGANESQSLTVANLPASPAYEVVLDLAADGLMADNRQWSIPTASGTARVILVSPGGNRFLHEALKLRRIQVEIMTQLPSNITNTPDLWIFDGVVPEQLPPGNVLLIGPNKAASWLPFQGKTKEIRTLKTMDQTHPVMRYADFRQLHVNETARVAPMKDMKSLLQSGEVPLILAGNIEGRRSVILGFDLHQSDLPLRTAFPILMQNVLTWLTPVQSAPFEAGQPGSVMTIPLTPGAKDRSIVLPDGNKVELQESGTSFLFQVPEQVGLYRLEERMDGKITQRLFQVSMQEEEKDITPSRLQVEIGEEAPTKSASENSVRGINSYQTFTGWLILIALVILFTEWRVYQRGY
ncbi:vWA domain-containing protein [Brevibacillus migulae]|uniref:vWA domain-containing protein n=1 Tax=Brevibacillus migulae TaxID=1644114 RepID=UPI001F19BAEC|nr:BatA and WFA domain-containing protein [Brevibacillus migulae]